MNMISVEMEDVLAVLQLCKPYIIGMIAAVRCQGEGASL